MAVAVLEKGDEVLPRAPEDIPKLCRAVFLSGRHARPQPPDHIVDRGAGKPAVGLDRYDLALSFHQAEKRDHIGAVGRLELGPAGWLPAGPLESPEELALQPHLPIAEAGHPPATGDETTVQLELA